MARIGLCGDNSTNNFANLTTANTLGFGTEVISGVVIVTTNITINNPVHFEAGAAMTINGCTVTFAGGVTGPMSQIFTYVSSGVVVFSDKQECPAEWWGAKNDGTTDSYNAIMAALGACSRVKLRGGTYYTSSTIKIASYQSLEGAGRLNTTLQKQTATGDIVNLTPLSGYVAGTQATYVANPRIREMTVSRSVTPQANVSAFDTASPVGVRVLGCNGFEITNVTSENNGINFYFGATNGGYVTNPYSTISLGSAAANHVGYYIDGLSTDGTTGSPNSSLRLTDPVMKNNISGNKVTHGFYINGHYADIWLERPETSLCYRGIRIDGGTATDKYVPDVHIIQPVNDRFYTNGIFAQNMNKYTQATIYGGNCAPDATANASCAGVYLQSCTDSGITISNGHQVWGTNYSATTGFLLNTCNGIQVDVNVKDCSLPVQIWGMKYSKVTGLIRNNDVTATDAVVMDSATGPITTEGNYFGLSIRASAGRITNGYKINATVSGACARNEYNCTMIDSSSVTTKLNNAGTAITVTGIFGTGNVASGVMT